MGAEIPKEKVYYVLLSANGGDDTRQLGRIEQEGDYTVRLLSPKEYYDGTHGTNSTLMPLH